MAESVGRKLQQARLARRLEVEEVAERTKIRPDRIIDLEADEYSRFPNLTYAKSFLAKYARFLGLDIQQELDDFQISRAISMGDYQYLSSMPPHNAQQARWTQRIQPKGFRVPPAVVVVLVLIVLVGVPVISYLALNIPRVAGTNFSTANEPANHAKIGSTSSASPVPPVPSDANPTHALAAQSPSGESSAAVSPSSSQPSEVKADATPARNEDRIEVRRAQAAGTPAATTPVETSVKTGLATLPEKKLEVRVIKRTYVKVTKDEEGAQPVFDGFAGPDSRPIVVQGKRFWVHVLDKGAVEVREDGQLVPGNSGDIVID
jgi:cytoskeletal protein RodZ